MGRQPLGADRRECTRGAEDKCVWPAGHSFRPIKTGRGGGRPFGGSGDFGPPEYVEGKMKDFLVV